MPEPEATDLLLTHGYFLEEDPVEQAVMRPYPPLGILYLSSYLKARAWRVSVFDSTFSSRTKLLAKVAELRPRFVGIYANLMTRKNVVPLMAEIRRAHPGVRVIVGGPDASSQAERYIEHGADAVVRGEGEETLAALMTAWTDTASHPPGNIAGTTVRGPSGVSSAHDRALLPSLEGHPWPDRGAIDLSPYLRAWKGRHGFSSVSLITARGCPYSCRWCSRSVYGSSHRRRPVEDVVAEVAWIQKELAPDRLWYVDDVFTIHKGWTLSYSAALRDAGVRMPFECISRAERIDVDIADALKGMGCVRVWIGTESGSQRILDAMERRVRVEQIQAASHLLRERGIEVGFFLMVGYEGEDEADIAATIEHVRKSKPDVVLTTLSYPIHGTPYADDVGARAINPRPWAETSDRETEIKGRQSRRYYDFARVWIESDALAHKWRRQGSLLRALPYHARASWARLRLGLERVKGA